MSNIRYIREQISGPLNHQERQSVNDLITRVNLMYNPPHAFLYFNDETETLDMSLNTWVQLTNATNDLFANTDSTGMTIVNDSVVVITPGDYIFNASVSFSGTTNADVYEFALFKNGNLASPKIERTTTSTDIGNVSLPFYMDELVVGDTLTLRMRNTATAFDATLIACSWVIWLLHY